MDPLIDAIADELKRQFEEGGLGYFDGTNLESANVDGIVNVVEVAEAVNRLYQARLTDLIEAINRHEARARWCERFAKLVERNILAGFTVIGRSMLTNMLRDYRKEFPREPLQ